MDHGLTLCYFSYLDSGWSAGHIEGLVFIFFLGDGILVLVPSGADHHLFLVILLIKKNIPTKF